MAAKKQQTHAKRARELAVKEKRERKAAKKAARAAGELPETDVTTGSRCRRADRDTGRRVGSVSTGQREVRWRSPYPASDCPG